ncbi:hypothetical protein ACIBP6_17595 [Nonomuraea terrae]|uniref:hypothetical protein n=1 Tax=Nonomuraea terrae TaxID=2530383 RepID=UPI0037BC0005
MTTEQETGRSANVRRAVPKAGTRRSATPPQSTPRPRPDVRAEAEAKRSAAERARAEAAGRRPADERVRAEAGGAPADERGRSEARRPVSARAGAAARPSAAERARGGVKAPATGRGAGVQAPPTGRGTGVKAPPTGRGTGVKAPPTGRGTGVKTPAAEGAATKRPAASRAAAPSRRPAPRRGPARRQRAPFVLLVVGLLCGGLVSLLLLNTMLAQDTITDATLRNEIAVARQENEKIELEYQRKTQPDVIAELAEKQGQHPDWDDVNSWSSAGDQVSRVDAER